MVTGFYVCRSRIVKSRQLLHDLLGKPRYYVLRYEIRPRGNLYNVMLIGGPTKKGGRLRSSSLVRPVHFASISSCVQTLGSFGAQKQLDRGA